MTVSNDHQDPYRKTPDKSKTRAPGLATIQSSIKHQASEYPDNQNIHCLEGRLFGQSEGTSLLEFVRIAYESSIENSWEKTRRSSTWKFCQTLKAHPQFAELEIDELLEALASLIELSADEQIAIADEWTEVRGIGALEWAAAMARQRPLKNPPGPKLYLYRQFVSLAAHLQVIRGKKPIQLPVQNVARALFISPSAVSRLRKIAIRYRLLIEVAPYKFRYRATDFKFTVERFPELKERQ